MSSSPSAVCISLVSRSQPHQSGTTVAAADLASPGLDRDGAIAIAPGEKAFDRFTLLLVRFVVRVVQREFPQFCELAFDVIQPGRIGRREVQLHFVLAGPIDHLLLLMRALAIQDDVQRVLGMILPSHPLQECEQLDPCFAVNELAEQLAGLQIVGVRSAESPTLRCDSGRRL